MPTYTVLGATGAAGTSVLRHLLTRAPVSSTCLHLCVRSTKKLVLHNPRLITRPNTSIFEGTLDQKAVITRAIQGADYIFACTGDNESPPQLSVSLDTANAIGDALQALVQSHPTSQEEKRRRKPTVVMLSSDCLSQTCFVSPLRRLVRILLRTALSNSCADLRRAENRYRDLASQGLLHIVFARPGSLMSAPAPTGHALSTSGSTLMLGYADLGPGMVEMAERAQERGYAGCAVSVNATGHVPVTPAPLLQYFISGIVARFWPEMWPWGRKMWRNARAAWSGMDAVEVVPSAKVEA